MDSGSDIDINSGGMDDVGGMDDEFDDGEAMEKDKEVDVMKDGTTKKKIITEGSGWEKPKQHYEVMINLTGKHNEEIFDSNGNEGAPRMYILGSGSLCNGVDETLKTMKKGEKATVEIPAQHAFGDNGWPEKGLPGGSDVQYELELVSWMAVEDVKKDGGVFVKTIEEGQGYVKPRDKDAVFLRYRGTLEEGEISDSTTFFISRGFGEGEEPVRLILSDISPPGLQEGLKRCDKGSRVIITLKSTYAYGTTGDDALGIPPNAIVRFEVVLVRMHTVEDPAGDGGVVVELHEKPTSAWEKPKPGAKCTVSFTVAAKGGEESLEGAGRHLHEAKSVEMEIGGENGEDVTEGLELAVEQMVEGQKADVTVRPAYGYGEAGRHGWVEGTDMLHYTVTLEKHVAPPSVYSMSHTAKKEFSDGLKARGNTAFKAGRVRRAKRLYNAALSPFKHIEGITDSDEKQEAQSMRSACYLNLAACYDKEANWQEVLSSCNKVLDVQRDNPKALFRRARAHSSQGSLLQARQDLEKLLEKDASDKAVVALMAEVRKKEKVQDAKDRVIFSKMFI
eukprot:CAMPEP_0181305416 /NCGR_PEP_ID=MMETSP1101-20121128/9718_1 /TAXON_ID=46948 /ORGANISM="Rhodomonas abbreviata, Strain Caron Lab Isolate" /LENGTH=561 /DNA_ID=CAMNT_0023411331 /DNA_START=94 /DNA_END=1779 /DNA_ORIENTATION=+